MYVMGTPAPQGSKKAFQRGGKVQMVESSKRVAPWREAVVSEAIRCGISGKGLDGPLRLSAVFFFGRPKGHYRTGRNAHLLRPNAPSHPTSPPDLSKLVRSTEDALTQCGAIRDDARIVVLDVRKEWCDDLFPVPGAWVQVQPLRGIDEWPGPVQAGDGADTRLCCCGASSLPIYHSLHGAS